MQHFTDLSGDQARQLLNVEQAFGAFRATRAEYRLRYAGSMSWKTVAGRLYLYRKSKGRWKSLGVKSPDTEGVYEHFHSARAAAKERLAALDARIRDMAPVNRALRLARMPLVSARLLRRLDQEGLLGRGLSVVGTHALFAYERLAGVHLAGEHVATLDIDLLHDSRRALKLLAPEIRDEGLLGLLKRVDKSFQSTEPSSFRAANKDGFLVDLIQPLLRNHAAPARSRIGSDPADLSAIEIQGLQWLESSLKMEAVAIDEKGFPAQLAVPDPRAFALHKLWLSERDDRDPLKRKRDRRQADVVAQLVCGHLPHLRFDDPALSALPEQLRDRICQLVTPRAGAGSIETPGDW